MIVEATKLKEAIEQALQEINDACYQMRQEGVVVLLPEQVQFEVQMVTDNDINAVTRTATDAESDGGSTVTLREQLASDSETVTKSGERFDSIRTPTQGTETTTVTHPSVQTQQSGGDDSEENVVYRYEPAE